MGYSGFLVAKLPVAECDDSFEHSTSKEYVNVTVC